MRRWVLAVLVYSLITVNLCWGGDKLSLFNFKTGRFDKMDTLPNKEGWRDYIWQLPAAQGMYSTYLAMGLEPTEAALKVLKAQAGEGDKPGMDEKPSAVAPSGQPQQ